MSQVWMEFIFEIAAPDGLTTGACASWIARLYHESFDNTMENVAVVITIFTMHTEVLHWFRTFGAKQFQMNISTCCVYRCCIVQFLETYFKRNSIINENQSIPNKLFHWTAAMFRFSLPWPSGTAMISSLDGFSLNTSRSTFCKSDGMRLLYK